MTRGWRRALAAMLLALVQQAWAQPALCPDRFPTLPPAARVDQTQALQQLAPLEAACDTRADYFAWQGSLMLALGQPQQAAVALEKALLLNPDLGGAQLDYAQALAQSGQLPAARELVADVMQRPDTPLVLRDWLGQALQPGLEGWRGSAWIRLMAGRESNFNSAPGSSLIELTLPSGIVPVELAPSQRPKSGWATFNSVGGEAVHSLGSGTLVLNGDATLRNAPSASDTNLSWVDTAATWLHPWGAWQVGARADTTRLWMAGTSLFSQDGLRLFGEHGLDLGLGECRGGGGLHLSHRHYPQDSTLDGQYQAVEGALRCQRGQTTAQLKAELGTDRAGSANRLGGDQGRLGLAATLNQGLGRGNLQLTLDRSRLRDGEIYSSLLGGVVRTIDRTSAQLLLSWPIQAGWSLQASLETISQVSNIPLFALSNRAVYLGMRWASR